MSPTEGHTIIYKNILLPSPNKTQKIIKPLELYLSENGFEEHIN